MHNLYLGNGVEIVKGLGLPSDARIIFDPPYGYGSYETDKELPSDFYRWLIDSFQTVAFFGYPEKLVALCVRVQAIPVEWVTWHASNKNAASRMSKNILPKEAECIAIFGDMPNPMEITRKRVQKGPAISAIHAGRGNSSLLARLGDVWNDPAPGMMFNSHLRLHPNEKPLSIMSKLITLCSNAGDLVVDPTMGSGTTGEASLSLSRNFVGCEVDPEHFETASNRINNASLQAGLFVPTNLA